jgi:DNA topoisomerase VI subunit B
VKAEFYAASSREPEVSRGRPFQIEAAIAFGGELPTEDTARVIRFANRVPLLFQQSACSSFKAVAETGWRNYNLSQPRGSLPNGPLVIMIHVASVWVPFTSESKEAIADYDEIRKEIKLALQECGRRLGVFLRRRERAKSEFRRRNIFELYIEEVVEACARLKGGKLPKEKLKTQLQKIAAKRTGGARTDEILGQNGGPEGLPHSIIVTPEGPEGEAPALPGAQASAVAAPEEPEPETETAARGGRKGKAPSTRSTTAATGKTRPAKREVMAGTRRTKTAKPKTTATPRTTATKRKKR